MIEKQDTISVSRLIDRLDACFNNNDMKGARECIQFWESEARRLNDKRGLLTVLNEAVGYARSEFIRPFTFRTRRIVL